MDLIKHCTAVVPPALCTAGVSPALCTAGVSPALCTAGVSPALCTAGVPPALCTAGVSPALCTAGVPPELCTAGVSPAFRSRQKLLRSLFHAFFFLAMTTLLISCKPKQDINALAHPVHVDAFMKRKLESDLTQMRKQKDQHFKTASDSPIPVQLKSIFTGLEYYQPDWRYRFEGPVIRYPNPAKFQIITTSGVWRDVIKFGFIRFQLQGQEFKLEVYRLLDLQEKNLLFVPFVDANVGKETYPAGRYIDLVEKPDGRYVIDFNSAYNPSCAYGGNYPCPVTPKENHLPIAIPAGEKNLPIAAALNKSKPTA